MAITRHLQSPLKTEDKNFFIDLAKYNAYSDEVRKGVHSYDVIRRYYLLDGVLFPKIALKLLPMFKFEKMAMGGGGNVMNVVYKTLIKGVSPVSIKFLDKLSIQALEEKFNKGLPKEAGVVITDIDESVEKGMQVALLMSEENFKAAKAFKIEKDEFEARDICFARWNCSQSINIYGNLKPNEDIIVPRSKLLFLFEAIAEISSKYSFKIPCFRHTGDGNVHANVMVSDKNKGKELKIGYEAMSDIFKLIIEFGKTLSQNCSIGFAKAIFMPFFQEEMNLCRCIKKTFNSNYILNPFKMGL